MWEASMHSRFDFLEKWGFGFLLLPVLLAVTMFVLWAVEPKTSLIADIVQAEFPGK